MPASKSNFGVNTYSFTLDRTAQTCVTQLAELGYNQFELMMYPGHLWPSEMSAENRRAFRNDLEAGDLEIISVNQPNVDINIGAANPEMRAYTLDILSSVIELAGDIGAKNFIMGPGKQNPLMAAPNTVMKGHFFDALDVLAPKAKAAGVTILLENMPFAYLPKAHQVMDILSEYGDDSIGTIYDVANGAFIGQDVAAELAEMMPRLKMVHFSDTGMQTYRHDPIGDGEIDFKTLKTTMDDLGWAGPTVLEIIAQTADPIADLQNSVARLAELGW